MITSSQSNQVPTQAIAVALVLWAVLGGTACLDSQTKHCSWGHLCPKGLICDPVGQTCIHPSQELICRGLADGTECTPDHTGGDPHVCVAQICRRSHCGDGLTDPSAGEVCDDGNTDSGDGCRADCRGQEECGDGLYDPAAGEVCDDGNDNDNDQCTQLCDRIRCGDGLLSGLEICDHGDDNSDTEPDACRTDCTLARCGDGVVDAPDTSDCWSQTTEQIVATSSTRILAADLNVDGRDDLLVWSNERSRFEVYLSQGDGTLVEANRSPHSVSGIDGLAVADLNGDGAPDVVAISDLNPPLRVYLADATGLAPLGGGVLSLPRSTSNVVVGDFNGDLVPDLVGLYGGDCELDVTYGLGDGTFAGFHSATLGVGGCWSDAMQAADMDGDGNLDIVVAAAEDGVFVMRGDGLGNFESPPRYEGPKHPGSTIRDMVVADVNGNGLPDILYPEQYPPQSPLRVLINQGNFQFTEAPGTPLPLGVSSLRLDTGDIDGNGTPDVAVIDLFASVVFLVMSSSDGTLSVVTPPPGTMALTADDVAFGHFYDSPFGGLALLKIADHSVTYWAFEP